MAYTRGINPIALGAIAGQLLAPNKRLPIFVSLRESKENYLDLARVHSQSHIRRIRTQRRRNENQFIDSD